MNTLALGTARRANRMGVHRKGPTSPYADKLRSIFGGRLVDHWPFWNGPDINYPVFTSGIARGMRGTGNAIEFGQTGIGDGRMAPFFDGVGAYINIASPELGSAFNGQEFTISLWFKVTTPVWTDTVSRRVLTIQITASERILFQKNPNTGFLMSYLCTGVTKGTTRPVAGTTANWTHAAMTVSKSADQCICYWNGVVEGGIQTGLGTWPATALGLSLVGASSTAPAGQMLGHIAHLAIGNRALTAAEVAALAVVP